MKKILLTSALLAMGLSGCASAKQDAGSASKDPQQAIQAAKAETDKAAAVGYEWRDTRKIIAKAEKAAKAGNDQEAVKLANQAYEQSEDALKQYQEQKDAGPHGQ